MQAVVLQKSVWCSILDVHDCGFDVVADRHHSDIIWNGFLGEGAATMGVLERREPGLARVQEESDLRWESAAGPLQTRHY